MRTFDTAFSARSEITHRISVRRHIRAKRASMRAHASQASADGGADRTLAAFLRIPRPLYDLVFGREWFVDRSLPAGVADPPRRLRRPDLTDSGHATVAGPPIVASRWWEGHRRAPGVTGVPMGVRRCPGRRMKG